MNSVPCSQHYYIIFLYPSSHRQWPTFPQVYMSGELVGGADIMLQLHQNGELVGELDKIGHKSALVDADTDTTKQS